MKRITFVLVPLFALALLLAVSAPALADDAKGKIKSIKEGTNELTLTTADNKEMTFQLDEKAKIRLNDADKKLTDLKVGDQVEVRFTKQGDKNVALEVRCDRK